MLSYVLRKQKMKIYNEVVIPIRRENSVFFGFLKVMVQQIFKVFKDSYGSSHPNRSRIRQCPDDYHA